MKMSMTDASQIALLDAEEVLKGYEAGRRNEPISLDASYSFHHGWRNGMVDGGHRAKDEAQAQLAHDYLRVKP